jgi:acetoacetyl-CoA synthetase
MLQCRLLGSSVEAFDEQGHSLTDEVGELVITQPMPSMPLYFWNDPAGQRYSASYFSMYPGVWRHGDWIKITPHGSAIIYGRSDSTINRMGIRMGSSEIYRVVEGIPEVLDSLIIGVEQPGGRYYMPPCALTSLHIMYQTKFYRLQIFPAHSAAKSWKCQSRSCLWASR